MDAGVGVHEGGADGASLMGADKEVAVEVGHAV